MPDGLLFGLAAAAAWGSTDILAALASRRIGGFPTAAITQLTSLLGLLAFILVSRAGTADGSSAAPFLPPPEAIPLAVGVGLIAAVSYLTFYVALRLGPIAVVSPVGSAYGAVAVVLSVVLLGERPTAPQALGVVVATAGVLAVSLRLGGGEGRPRVTGPGVPFVVVALLAWGLMTVGIAALVRGSELLPSLLAVRLTTTSVVWAAVVGRWLVGRRVGRALVDAPVAGASPERGRAVVLSCAAGLFDIAGYVAYATGLQAAAAWLVGLTSSFGPAVAFLFAIAFLGDRLRLVQWLGLAGLGVGLVLVGLR